ncbi:hypothetical protein [Mesorhizobium sp.]|uniref:hypothetical protein n=1 Tax=Mesorhizobium sp. TaxID=1871066 RepID=UPI000FE8D0DC|nr:hypothetical protein [Mesorhizobium sp.]RWN24377.1 MAG: hypothetical protein EOR95_33135 [Mesorhizobium sp.]
MEFYIFGSVSFVFAIILAVFGVISKSIDSNRRVSVIFVAAIISVPGYIVIWDFAFYKEIWFFWWG